MKKKCNFTIDFQGWNFVQIIVEATETILKNICRKYFAVSFIYAILSAVTSIHLFIVFACQILVSYEISNKKNLINKISAQIILQMFNKFNQNSLHCFSTLVRCSKVSVHQRMRSMTLDRIWHTALLNSNVKRQTEQLKTKPLSVCVVEIKTNLCNISKSRNTKSWE